MGLGELVRLSSKSKESLRIEPKGTAQVPEERLALPSGVKE